MFFIEHTHYLSLRVVKNLTLIFMDASPSINNVQTGLQWRNIWLHGKQQSCICCRICWWQYDENWIILMQMRVQSLNLLLLRFHKLYGLSSWNAKETTIEATQYTVKSLWIIMMKTSRIMPQTIASDVDYWAELFPVCICQLKEGIRSIIQNVVVYISNNTKKNTMRYWYNKAKC